MRDISEYLAAHQADFEDDLCELLRIPSVSADPAFHSDCAKGADWVAARFRKLGLATELIPTCGQPLVFAQSEQIAGTPTVLVYGHYDVQPPDPLDQWISPPFEPTMRDGNLYARGATDDKGQMFTHIASAQTWLKTRGRLPVNLKYIIEGEEESGSSGINEYIATPAAKEKLACDIIVISDTSQFGPGQPAITYGLRGGVWFELRVTGPKQDLHSGTFGGGVTNPLIALSKMLSALIDAKGRIQLPGFYDDVVPLSERERQQFAALPFNEQAFMQQLGVTGLTGEEGFTTLERRWARPTFDIHGLGGGYQGPGPKSIVPATGFAKISFRLVPKQQPEKISAALHQFLQPLCPPGATLEILGHHGAPGVLTSLESPYVSAAQRAIEQGFGTKPVFIREGGSIPIVSTFAQRLGADTLLLGWGLDDDNTHSPNEKFCRADFHRGIKASAYLWEELGRLKKN
jgi:acetylornithine deacetylase/succinyl-diaminopimelate desuccinylase-like protein